jgi:hypothetical protein
VFLVLTFANEFVGAESVEIFLFKDQTGIKRSLELAKIRQIKVKVESYGVITYGNAKLRMASSRALAAAQSEAETMAASLAANALGKQCGQEVINGVSSNLSGGRVIYSGVHEGSVEVVWIYSP